MSILFQRSLCFHLKTRKDDCQEELNTANVLYQSSCVKDRVASFLRLCTLVLYFTHVSDWHSNRL